ncbi:hypothetical protein Aduo_004117 [Ancylostoma duodenale]
MQSLTILCSLALSCFASPVVQQQAASGSSQYNLVFIQGYNAFSQGTVSQYAIANIKSANSGRLQFDEMYGALRNANINMRSVWIMVTSPNYWNSNSTMNNNFLNSILSRASQYGLSIGIYTKASEWIQITGNATTSNIALWYWSYIGGGTAFESPANYNDFSPFGGWKVPSAKQFGELETVCGITLNRDIYTVSGAAKFVGMAKYEKSEQIVVGSLGLGTVLPGKAEIKE